MATGTSYAVQVTALRITLLDGDSAKTVINLANTRTEIRTY